MENIIIIMGLGIKANFAQYVRTSGQKRERYARPRSGTSAVITPKRVLNNPPLVKYVIVGTGEGWRKAKPGIQNNTT